MRRLTKAEKAAAAAVLAAAAGVAVTGISLLKKHAKFMAKKAAAAFREKDESSEKMDMELVPDEEEAPDGISEPVNEGEDAKERQYIKL